MLDLGRTFLQSVERSPHALALVDGELKLSYLEWLKKIAAVAHGLSEQGLKRGDKLVVALQNRWEMATLHWACQFQGIVVVPLNWRCKPDELDYCLSDSQASGVVFEGITAAAVAGSPRAAELCRIVLDQAFADAVAFEEFFFAHDGAIEPVASAEDISLILYTSGTTGKPKGVPRRHRHERAAALAHVAQNLYRHGEQTLGVMPLYHTMGVRSLLAMALTDGLFVCVRRWHAAHALNLIEEYKLTCLYLVPTLYHDLLGDQGFDAERARSVTKLGFAGASMSDGLLKRLSEAFEPELFVNHYGSSEIYTVSIDQHATRKPGSAGRAGLNARLRIVRLDAATPADLAKPGDEGQIIADLLGDEAFEGYWQRPDANQKALRGGWYFTGDTGYFDTDGDLYVTGRVDDMIISGGENISPVDIESVLSLHPAVDEVAVAGLKDERWGQRVVAFIKRRGAVDAAALDLHCKTSDLVNFKRPREYVFVNEIPKSPVGKILRRKLTAGEYEPENMAPAAALATPRNNFNEGTHLMTDLTHRASTLLEKLDGFRVEIDAARERADIILDRPPLNVIAMGARDQLKTVFEALDDDDRVRVIVVRAGGEHFSSGGDIKGFMEASPEHVSKLAWNIAAPARCSKPVIAANQGYCFGVGFELSLACDFRIATTSTQYALPEQKLGQIPGSGGSARLQKMIGIGRTKDVVMRSRRISGQQALDWGLAVDCVADADLTKTTDALVDELRGFSPLAQRTAKKLLNDTEDAPLSTAIELEGHGYSRLRMSHDFKEGVEAFHGKRKPNFTGS